MCVVELIVSAIVVTTSCLLVGYYLSGNKIDIKNKVTIISIILFSVIFPIISSSINDYYKIIFNYLIIGCLFKFVYGESISKSLTMSIITVIYFFIAEIIISILLTAYLAITSTTFDPSLKGSVIMNVTISVIVIILSRFKATKSIADKVIPLFSKYQVSFLLLIIVLAIGIFGIKNVSFIGVNSSFIMNLAMILAFATIVFYLFRERENSKILSDKYDQLLSYIQKYEAEITDKNITIHEFKNQLIAIKSLVSPRNKELSNYVNSIIKDVKNSQYNGLENMQYLPQGGLKGLIYFKLGDLSNKGIKVITKIDRKLKNEDFYKKNGEKHKDILKIIGVYLDNAIEAVSEASIKEIILEMYCEKNECHFILSNTYAGQINISNFGDLGYSTKGEKRGYGLHLVDKIIKKYDNLTQIRELDEKYYTIHLIIKK